MPITTIYLVRHGFRGNWVQDPLTGVTTSTVKSPTNIPSDPALASYGVEQSLALAERLIINSPLPTVIYSSPFYRCIQTLQPFAQRLGTEGLGQCRSKKEEQEDKEEKTRQVAEIVGDRGLGEWYGTARFDHPRAASDAILREFFPTYTERTTITPPPNGETLDMLHERCAVAMQAIIQNEDQKSKADKAIVISTHAATMIAIARVLTGEMPKDVNEEDFKTFTCGISTFVRRREGDNLHRRAIRAPAAEEEKEEEGVDGKAPSNISEWKNGKGVAGGWNCTVNSDCSHLPNGEERGWYV
ncbi:hypothetical protein MMC09_001040 [Bachmanniomyces sp. S44760]|nr:hypothetical protein [Bachmanniomyces sp. S44760]